MRRSIAVVILMCAFLFCAAAQSLQVESFDRGGLPARAQTDAERELLRRISAHRRGDVADAVEIQRQLAAYYRAKGDDERARAAEARVNAGTGLDGNPMSTRPYGPGQAPSPGGIPMAAPGAIRNPARGGVPLPSPGGKAPRVRENDDWGSPAYGVIPIPARTRPPDDAKAPAYGPPASLPADTPQTTIPVYAGDGAPGTAKTDSGVPIPVYRTETGANERTAGAGSGGNQDAAAAPGSVPVAPGPAPNAGATPAAPTQPFEFTGRFYALQGQVLHTWEFRPDGTFEHGWVARGAPSGAANVEAGMFRVAGPYLMLTILRGATGHAGDSRGGMTGGGAGGGHDMRQLIFRVLGAGGRDGVVVGGMVLRRATPEDQYH